VELTALLLAQAADPISGGAGWAGAGLLGLVLCWLLLKHLPDKDRQINNLVEAKDRQMTELRVAMEVRIDTQRRDFIEALGSVTTTYRAEAAEERKVCALNFRTLADTINVSFRTLGDQLQAQARASSEHSARNQQWLDVMKREIEVKKKGGEGS
jgi:hypothetical protein